MDKKELAAEVARLKEEKNAVILAHNYQIGEVQDVADYVGDSFGLAQKAAEVDAEVIIFCGVHFMAESAKILAPEKKVILPVKEAGCPLADMADVEAVRAKKKEHPDAALVAYVNTSAAVKAEIDVCCTSSNAVKVVESLPEEKIIFLPDKNLGQYIADQTDKEIIIWEGYCITHHRVDLEELKKAREAHPEAPIAVHPECQPEVVREADYVGGTSGILKFARETDAQSIIIGTEMGMLHRLKKENPGKTFYLLSPRLICVNMKKTTLEKVAESLQNLSPQIEVEEEIAQKARKSLERMLAIK